MDDLAGENGKLRSDVEAALEKLVASGALMRVGHEYRLQTKEGSEWDREFRNRQTKLASAEDDIHIRRDQLLYAEADRIIRTLRITQGAAKESRQLSVSRDQNPPDPNGEAIPVWVRDGWSTSEKEFADAARKAGGDSPVIFVHMSKRAADDLRRLIIDAEAAEQTLNFKGNPSTAEGQEARHSMESRFNLAKAERDRLVGEIAANAKVFQGGGNELLQAKLEDRLLAAANDSLVRLFPRFREADSYAWEGVIKRARDGADQPFQPLGYTGPTEQHPVCQQVSATIGSGKTGSEIRKTFRSSPFGWPQDAIDAALIALHRSQHITAALNSGPVALGQLDQNKIAKAEFRVERATLTMTERLKIRSLFKELSITCKSGEEAAKAAEFVNALSLLAASAGGHPPLPAAPATIAIEDLGKLAGSEQLVAIKDKEADLRKWIADWKRASDLANQRRPVWETVERMARHAAHLPAAAEAIEQVEGIRRDRLLLQPTDPVSPIRTKLAEILRQSVSEAQSAHEKAYSEGLAVLSANETWARVAESDRRRIMSEAGLAEPAKDDVSADTLLLAALDARPLSGRWAEADAVPGRVQKALELAARLLEPKVQTVTLERATLKTEADVQQWLERQQKRMLEALKQGPVLVK